MVKSLDTELHFHFMSSVSGEHFPSCHFVGLPLGGLSPPCKGPETWKRSNSILGENEPNWEPFFFGVAYSTPAGGKWKRIPRASASECRGRWGLFGINEGSLWDSVLVLMFTRMQYTVMPSSSFQRASDSSLIWVTFASQ